MRPELIQPLVPIALAAFALAAAFAIARRIGRTGVARWLDAGLVWLALVAVPPYALGWLGLFHAPVVALASLVTSAIALATATRLRTAALRSAALDLARALLAPVTLLRDAIDRRAWLAAIAVALASGVWIWTALLAWLVPSSGWDGIWYHDTIVGFTIQERGFAEVALPREHELVNGYPRLVETIAAFFVVLSDDRFLEIAPTLAWPWVAVAFAALASGLTGWWSGRVAMACAFALVPALTMQLRSSYVDVPASFFALAALVYVTRRRLRAADLWLAGLACGLLLASKATGLMQTAVLGAIALARVAPRPRPAMLAGIAAAALLILAIGSPTYVRNLRRHDNPVWPITHEIESLGLRFEGLQETTIRSPSLEDWLRGTYGPPQWEEYHHDVRPDGYGHAFPLLIPVVFVTALLALLAGEGDRRRRLSGTPIVWIALGGGALALATPPLWWGRFGIPVLACAVAIALAWLAARPRIGASAIALVLVVHGYTLMHARPGWHASFDDARELIRRPAKDRATFPVGPVFGDEPALRAFEREIGPGDVVVWTTPNGFPSFTWNRHMSNRSVYVPRVSVAELEALGADWVIVSARGGAARALDRVPELERVGRITDVLVGYRRVARSQRRIGGLAVAEEER